MADDIKIKIIVQTASGKKEIKDFNREVEGLGKSASKAGKQTSSSFKGVFGSAKKFIGMAGVAGLVITASKVVSGGFTRMVSKGREFQGQLADLSAITGIAGDDLTFLGDESLKTSRKYGRSASDIIEANKLVASQLAEKIDFGTDEGIRQLEEVSRQTVVLAQASGIDLNTAVQTTTTAINQFNLEASETDRIINSVAAGAKFGAAEAQAQSEAYREAGSVFAAANRDFEELNAATQVLAANAISGSRAGTGLRNVMTILQTEADKLAKYGIHDLNVEGEDFSTTLQKLEPLLGNAAAMAELFGRENLTAAQILIKNADAVESMTEKVTGSNTAYEQAEIRMNTFDGAMDKLGATIDSVLIPAFQDSSGAMVEFINTAVKVVEWTAKMITGLNSLVAGHQELRGELGQEEGMLEGVVSSFSRTRREMEELIKTTDLTIEQQQEFAEAYEYSTGTITAFQNKLNAEVDALEGRREKLRENIKVMEETGKGAGAYGEYLTNEKAKLEQVNISIAEKISSLAKLDKAMKGTAVTFEQFYNQILANEQGTDEVTERINQTSIKANEASVAVAGLNTALASGAPVILETVDGHKTLQEILAGTKEEGVTVMDALESAISSGINHALDQTIQNLVFMEGKMLDLERIGKNLLSGVLSGLAKFGLASLGGPAGGFFTKIFGFKDGGPIPGFSSGGFIGGRGTGRSDSNLIRGSRGEYMLNARSTSAIGSHRMDRINRSPGLAGAVGRLVDKLPHLSGDGVNMNSVENALRSSGGGGSSFSDKAIISKLDEVAARIENMDVSAFIDYNSFKKDLAKFDNIQKEMGKA